MWNPGPARKICTVRDGDIFDLGDKKLKVLEVPSHTLGCIALFEEKKGWLFTGDIMLTWEVWGHLNPGKSPLAPSASLRVYYESLLKLKKIRKKVSSVFPAHVCEKEKDCYKKYALSPEIINIYCDGIEKIFSGEQKGEPYFHMVENGSVVKYDLRHNSKNSTSIYCGCFFQLPRYIFQKSRKRQNSKRTEESNIKNDNSSKGIGKIGICSKYRNRNHNCMKRHDLSENKIQIQIL